MTGTGSADVVDREAAWLRSTGDGLPALLAADGGPFEVIQAYWPRTPATRATGLYVMRRRTSSARFANIRRLNTYMLQVRAWWPASAGSGSAETEQRALDAAVELVLQRVIGHLQDKTHGGAFMSAAEDPDGIEVIWSDPATAYTTSPAAFTADIAYSVDDRDYSA